MKINITSKKQVFNFCEPYVIAELGANHNGDMELAKKLIVEAKNAGADCVKFQSWTKDTIFSKKVYEDNYFLTDDYRNRSDFNLEKIIEAYSMSGKELLEMKKFSDEVGIDCSSTPFSKGETDFLVDAMNSPFIKIASMDLNNYPFIDYIARKGKPIIISTGLSELYEIDKAIRTIENAGNNQIVILHCVSIYPPKDEDVNLNNIETLRRLYPYPIGFSDHTLGFEVPLASVAMGACIIEKHFTLDKNLPGWDHKVSATPDEMKIICDGAKKISTALGSSRIICVENQERKDAFRRSIVLTRDIKFGEIILNDDLDYKRPGSGLAPEMRDVIVGKAAKRNLAKDEMILQSDF